MGLSLGFLLCSIGLSFCSCLEHSCLENPWTKEPGRLQFMGSLRVEQTERLHCHFSLSCIGEGNGNPLQCSCLENLGDGGAWWVAIYGVAQSWTRLKRLSSSSSRGVTLVFVVKLVWYCWILSLCLSFDYSVESERRALLGRVFLVVGFSLSPKETQMYRTVFWTLWERERVGWFGRMALKHL